MTDRVVAEAVQEAAADQARQDAAAAQMETKVVAEASKPAPTRRLQSSSSRSSSKSRTTSRKASNSNTSSSSSSPAALGGRKSRAGRAAAQQVLLQASGPTASTRRSVMAALDTGRRLRPRSRRPTPSESARWSAEAPSTTSLRTGDRRFELQCRRFGFGLRGLRADSNGRRPDDGEDLGVGGVGRRSGRRDHPTEVPGVLRRQGGIESEGAATSGTARTAPWREEQGESSSESGRTEASGGPASLGTRSGRAPRPAPSREADRPILQRSRESECASCAPAPPPAI
mmetsp:Transcript_97748/g.273565  ORF Transcript_97748/g.273565 Transcript_97748/m.273565 type:complete len:286 (+) Transcript_97748:643-1500(+)